jgi:hypothetical protein
MISFTILDQRSPGIVISGSLRAISVDPSVGPNIDNMQHPKAGQHRSLPTPLQSCA